MSATVKGTSPVTARHLLDKIARQLVTHATAATERVTRKRFVQRPILSSKAAGKEKEVGSRMEEKAREEVTDKREAGSKRAEKEKEAEKAKDGVKEKAVVSMTWIYGEDVRTSEWDNSSYHTGIRSLGCLTVKTPVNALQTVDEHAPICPVSTSCALHPVDELFPVRSKTVHDPSNRFSILRTMSRARL